MTKYKTLNNNFKYIEVNNTLAQAKIALQGAHVFEYKAKDKSALLWLSPKAYFEEGKAIRGGIPICFPWFGKHKVDSTLPQHGFARTSLWKVVDEEEKPDGSTYIRLQLTQNVESCRLWAYDFEVNLDVIVGETLGLTMHISNTGTKPFEVSTALHTYLNISDIENVEVVGLDHAKYYDALTKSTERQQGELNIYAEIDRVYQRKQASMRLLDKDREIRITSEGSESLVVWNPWKEKSVAMADMSDDGYKTMLCLETANAREDSRVIEVGKMHSIGVVYEEGEKMYSTPYCEVKYLEDKNAIFCQWKQFCKGDDYRNPFRYALDEINKYNISTWITDTTHGFENEEADTVWLLEEFMPKMIESSIEKIVFIIKNDSPLMDEIMGQVESLGEYFEVELVESFDV